MAAAVQPILSSGGCLLMNGRTYTYLELAALPLVGEVMLDPRPAFVFRADGTGLLWTNAAGAAFLGESGIGAALDRRFDRAGRLAAHVSRLAKTLPADRLRLELVRFPLGVTQVTLPVACRRLDLAGGARGVLMVGVAGASRESLSTRAERLADMIAGHDCLAAVIDRDGKVLGASGGFEDLAPTSAAIDALVAAAAAGDRPVVRAEIPFWGALRPAGVARLQVGPEVVFLLIVGPEHRVSPPDSPSVTAVPAEAALVKPAAPAGAETLGDAKAGAPEVPPPAAPASPALSAPALASGDRVGQHGVPAETGPVPSPPGDTPASVRFLWRTDAGAAFTFVSPEFAAAVGKAHAPRPGESWRALAARLGMDDDGRVAEALAGIAAFSGVTVAWPVAGTDEAVAIELAGFPEFARNRSFRGYRGFGTVDPSRRMTLAGAAPLSAEPDLPPERAGESGEAIAAAADMAVVTAPTEPPATGPAAPAPAEPPPEPLMDEPDQVSPPRAAGDLDDAARAIVEGRAGEPVEHLGEATSTPAATAEPAPPVIDREPEAAPPPPSNVVPINGGPVRALSRRLSGSEQDAFRRIAEALGARVVDRPEAMTATNGVDGSTSRPGQVDAAILDRLPIGIVVYRDRLTLYANRAALDLLGYRSFEDFFAAGGAEAIFPEDAGGRNPDAGLIEAARRDGSRTAVEARLHTVPWGGTSALLLTLLRVEIPPAAAVPAPPVEDAALRGRIRELETILDTATDGVVVIDGDGRIAALNRAAEALFGVEAAELAGKPFTDLFAEESRKSALDYMSGLAENGVASVLNDGREVIGRVPRGGLIPLFMTIGRLAESGKYCAVLRDITHWKNIEEELVAARRAAESANAQKSEFLAKISHEIRTPLNAIIGFSEVMMEERFGPIGSDRYRNYLRDIHLSGEHLKSLINDLLDLSKVEAGKLELNFESVAVNTVIQECVALMQPQANRERIIIRTSLAAGVPNVVADLRSIRQILLNLLSNAIKFTSSGGQVIVASAVEETGEVVLRIRDTGIGMSAKDIDTAMRPFRQVATGGRAKEGTGLGLPLTKALVEANRASFSIDSIPNQGTLVKITFPTTRVLAG
jgi:PAS domain S-box-containing protein